ncbi:hypothetical protein [Botrimarina hoheduenensis]|uniref:DUF5009 domain-containing protein n=1 Tax=Botrimarina hoheduenensis TaxID=2528000 RepID=A0A5C5WAL3_9BACT|nr:hypothetical protein [Botrimarina hoheduenensis]TWT47205.1 hypothetical protein Pla111_08170 [Botrimarina hoheduenensis]
MPSYRSVDTDSAPSKAGQESASKARRLAALDVYRGLTMLLLAFTVPNWGWELPLAEKYPWLTPLTAQVEHTAWRGLTAWDLIQPSFMFMVGVSLPYSVASRQLRGVSEFRLWKHAATRALLLVLLGVFLRSVGESATVWTLEDVVSQIGLGYLPLFWLARRTPRFQRIVFITLLGFWWAVYALWPIAAPLPAGAVRHFEGFWSHWNESVGPARLFDQWLLNLPPRTDTFTINSGGYYTLNFVPSIATMLLGVLAGQRLRENETTDNTTGWFVQIGALLLAAGLSLDLAGACPLVKKLWTPAFVLVSGGFCLMILGTLHAMSDLAGWRRWFMPAEVVGRNPLAMYVMTWTLAGWVLANLTTHMGAKSFEILGETYAPMLGNLATGMVLYLICWWMDVNRVYVRL